LAVVLLEELIQIPLAQLLDKQVVLAAVDRLVIPPMRQVKTLVLEQPDKARLVLEELRVVLIPPTHLAAVAVLVALVLPEQFTTTQVVLEHSLAESLATVVMVVNCLLAVLLQLMAAVAAAVWVELLQLIQQALELAAQAAVATVEWQLTELLVLQTPEVEAAVLDITERSQLVIAVEPAAAAS
jgi:hypothetical protein